MKNSLKILRDKHMNNVFLDLLHSGVNISLLSREQVADIVAHSQAPRFYITPKMAERYVYAYLRGQYKITSSVKKRMVDNLVEVYERLVRKFPHMKKEYIWYEVVQSPAKEFYVGNYIVIDCLYRKIYSYGRKQRNQN